jgi:tetratricopeptide (TPR) repeat protein
MPSHLVNAHLQHIAKQEAKFGTDSEEVAVALRTLCKLICQYEDAVDAVPYFDRCMRIREALRGRESILKELDEWIDKNAWNFEAVEPFLRKRLAIETEVFGEIDPRIADGCEDLARRYRNQKRYSEARELLERSLAIREATIGPNSPEVAATLEVLFEACLRSKQKQEDEAGRHLQRCLKIREQAFGENSEEVAKTLVSAAVGYLDPTKLRQAMIWHRIGAASPLFERGVGLMDQRFGPDSAEVQQALEAMARAYLQHREAFSKAEPLLRRLLSINEKIHGADAVELLWILVELAEGHANGRSRRAGPLVKRGFDIMRAFLDAKKPHIWEKAAAFSKPKGMLERLVHAAAQDRRNLRKRWGG